MVNMRYVDIGFDFSKRVWLHSSVLLVNVFQLSLEMCKIEQTGGEACVK